MQGSKATWELEINDLFAVYWCYHVRELLWTWSVFELCSTFTFRSRWRKWVESEYFEKQLSCECTPTSEHNRSLVKTFGKITRPLPALIMWSVIMSEKQHLLTYQTNSELCERGVLQYLVTANNTSRLHPYLKSTGSHWTMETFASFEREQK